MKVGIGSSYEAADPAFVDLILPRIDYVEVIPDTLAVRQGKRSRIPDPTLRELGQLARQATVIVHGVGLSIGSADGWNEDYFQLLDQVLEAVPVAWHSEHLAFSRVDGRFVGTMLALPRTQEVLDLVCERVRRIRERYALPFLLENSVNLLPDPPADFSEAAFLNRLARDSDCELLLDLYNLECNAHNQGYAIHEFLDELELDPVREIHLACGIEHSGLMLDIHSRRTRESTRRWLQQVIARAPNLQAVIYELMPEAVPTMGHASWTEEIDLLARLIQEDRWTSRPTSAACAGS
jgi:uncharacterized protein (UPF0276 family)